MISLRHPKIDICRDDQGRNNKKEADRAEEGRIDEEEASGADGADGIDKAEKTNRANKANGTDWVNRGKIDAKKWDEVNGADKVDRIDEGDRVDKVNNGIADVEESDGPGIIAKDPSIASEDLGSVVENSDLKANSQIMGQKVARWQITRFILCFFYNIFSYLFLHDGPFIKKY